MPLSLLGMDVMTATCSRCHVHLKHGNDQDTHCGSCLAVLRVTRFFCRPFAAMPAVKPSDEKLASRWVCSMHCKMDVAHL